MTKILKKFLKLGEDNSPYQKSSSRFMEKTKVISSEAISTSARLISTINALNRQ